MRTVRFTFAILLAPFFLWSCFPVISKEYRAYKGPSMPKDNVAYLQNYMGSVEGWSAEKVLIITVDGITAEKSRWDSTVRMELLPGKHVLELDYYRYQYRGRYKSVELYKVEFDAVAGHSYFVKPVVQNNRWYPVIVDITKE